MNTQNLIKFLLEANKHGYADDSVPHIKEADRSETIIYESGDWKYHDNYFGGEPYGGRLIVSHKNKPYWIMVYYGWVVSEIKDPQGIYKILRKALSQMPEDKPYRGPDELIDGEYRYVNEVSGYLENYFGEEVIYCNNKEVYRAKYIGGLVDRR